MSLEDKDLLGLVVDIFIYCSLIITFIYLFIYGLDNYYIKGFSRYRFTQRIIRESVFWLTHLLFRLYFGLLYKRCGLFYFYFILLMITLFSFILSFLSFILFLNFTLFYLYDFKLSQIKYSRTLQLLTPVLLFLVVVIFLYINI